jgi:hypothetical protein
MKKKIFVLSITALLFIGVVFSVNGYHEYITTWEGPAHEHCGHDASTPSVNGTMTLSLSVTGDLSPYQPFNVSLDVKNFTEALVDPYYGKIMLGIPGEGDLGVVMDNHLFSSPLGQARLNRRESVDAWGSVNEDSKLTAHGGGPSLMDCTFTLLAPGTAGTYTLMGLAIAGVNQSSSFADTVEHAEVNITYIEATIQVTVVGTAPVGDGGAIPGFLTLTVISTLGITVAIVILNIRRRKKIVK